MDIRGIGYLGFESPNIAAWRDYGPEVLGLAIAKSPEDEPESLYLRLDDRRYRFAFHPGPIDKLAYIGWEAPSTVAPSASTMIRPPPPQRAPPHPTFQDNPARSVQTSKAARVLAKINPNDHDVHRSVPFSLKPIAIPTDPGERGGPSHNQKPPTRSGAPPKTRSGTMVATGGS